MQLVCHHDPADPSHLVCELKQPRRHRWINVFLAGGVLWMAFLSGLIVWIILSRGEGGDSLQTLPDPRLGTRAVQSPLDSNVSTVPPSSSAGRDSFLIEDSTGRPAGFLGEDPAGSATQLGGEEKSLDYSGQIEPDLQVEALYFSKEGEQVGRGIWPPQVGEETRVMVFLRVGPVGKGVISGKMGEGVEWTGFAPMGAGLTYEPAIRRVRWVPQAESVAVFEVSITPNSTQITEGQALILGDIKLMIGDREIFSPNVVLGW